MVKRPGSGGSDWDTFTEVTSVKTDTENGVTTLPGSCLGGTSERSDVFASGNNADATIVREIVSPGRCEVRVTGQPLSDL